jgi:hypothetical protein
VDSLSSLFHYPVTYSTEEVKSDASGVAASLQFILDRFGAPRNLKPVSESSFYELGAFGGTNEYWRSLSPFESITFVYSAEFSRIGAGYFKVQVFKHHTRESREIQSIGFGIPESTPNAKAMAIDLILALMEARQMPTPPNFRELLEGQLQPVHPSGAPLP